jgi:proteasome lid subunit RPN8/RPN11
MTPVRISDELLEAIAAQAREEFPNECCGYLRGNDKQALALVQCRNAAARGEHPTHPTRGPETAYMFGDRELFDFARAFGDGLPPPLVVYHSHTNGRAYFSEVDRENATAISTKLGREHRVPTYPVQHLVVGVTREAGLVKTTEMALFAWDAELADFVEVARFGGRC